MKALFEDYKCAEDYINSGVRGIAPMLAKEAPEDEGLRFELLNSSTNIVEEKFDGTRATLHFFSEYVRCFSRRVSKKTDWFCENSDSLPHIRDLSFPEIEGTILDGEMFIPNQPFKAVSSTLNCKWDKAVERQNELGKIVFHAFDILYYKGICLERMPLHRRKEYLKRVVAKIDSPYIVEVPYYSCDSKIPVRISDYASIMREKNTFPNLAREMQSLSKGKGNNPFVSPVEVSPIAYYEYIVATGGEGVIVKPKLGKYFCDKRGYEFTKIKKFLTREVIITGFSPPTPEYNGKFPTIDKWDYWQTDEEWVIDLSTCSQAQKEAFKKEWYPNHCTPVSKFFAKNWVGNIRFGVIISDEDILKLPKSKSFDITQNVRLEGARETCHIIEVGECSGFDEETREYLTKNKQELVGSVIEVKANEIFKDTGKMRHPRFLRFREDKSPFECDWKTHVSEVSI